MPIYEFVCQACGYEFEKIQSFSNAIASTCPRCQSVEVERQMSRPAIHFKGSGWYINDSKSDNKDKKETDKKTATDEAANPETKTDSTSSAAGDATSKEPVTKPEAKPDAKPAAPATKEAAKGSSAPEKNAA